MVEFSEDVVQEILSGGLPSDAELVQDDGERRIIWYDGLFYKVVSNQDIDKLEEIYDDLGDSLRTPETSFRKYEHAERVVAVQEEIENDIPEAVEEYGLDKVVKESVGIWEDFVDQGYVVKELAPRDIRFRDGEGFLVDYLDEASIGRVEDTNMTPTANTSFLHFVNETSNTLDDEAYESIVEILREEVDYIDIAGEGNNLNGAIHYMGPEE